MVEEKKSWLVRIPDKSYGRLKKVAKIENLPLSTANELAINFFADTIEYGPKNIKKLLKEQPLLKVSEDYFFDMLKMADIETREAVVNILEQGNIFYYECGFEEFEDRIKQINKEKCKYAVPLLRIDIKKTPNPTEEVKKKIDIFFNKSNLIECKTNAQMFSDYSFTKEDSEDVKILILVSKKGDDENEPK